MRSRLQKPEATVVLRFLGEICRALMACCLLTETSNGKVACRAHKAFDNEQCLTSRSSKIMPMNEIRRLPDEHSRVFRSPIDVSAEE